MMRVYSLEDLDNTNKYASLSRQNKKLYYFFSVNDTTILFRILREYKLSIKTVIEIFCFDDIVYLNTKVYT